MTTGKFIDALIDLFDASKVTLIELIISERINQIIDANNEV